jgi:hypothetical protein
MMGLTVHQPFIHAFLHLGRDLEHRDWLPPVGLGRFAIHAGKLTRESPKSKWLEIATEILKLEEAGLMKTRPSQEQMIAESNAIVAVATFKHASRYGGNDPAEKSPWRRDDFEWAWVLGPIVPIQPVPCKGQQQLWKVPEPIAKIVRQRYALAIRPTTP